MRVIFLLIAIISSDVCFSQTSLDSFFTNYFAQTYRHCSSIQLKTDSFLFKSKSNFGFDNVSKIDSFIYSHKTRRTSFIQVDSISVEPDFILIALSSVVKLKKGSILFSDGIFLFKVYHTSEGEKIFIEGGIEPTLVGVISN